MRRKRLVQQPRAGDLPASTKLRVTWCGWSLMFFQDGQAQPLSDGTSRPKAAHDEWGHFGPRALAYVL